MTTDNITYYRLQSQQIAPGSHLPPTTPGELVAWMGAFQAQDFGGVKWSIGLRLPGSTEAVIDQAIADRTIVRTWPMRGTLHFVPAADVRWMLDLLTPRILAGSAARHRELELGDSVFERCRAVFTEALQGGRTLSREEMLAALENAGMPTGSQRGYHLLWRTAQEGLICFASHQGKQPTFALLDEWIPPAKRAVYENRTEALGELARRYFTSHGPATLHDFAWWTGLLMADARAGLEQAKHCLESVEAVGKWYWMANGLRKVKPVGRDSERVHLLPGFDEYMLGYKDRSAALDPLHAQKIVPGNNGVFLPTIVSRGQVAGIWKRTVAKRSISVTAQPFTSLSGDEEESFAAAAVRYQEFLTVA